MHWFGLVLSLLLLVGCGASEGPQPSAEEAPPPAEEPQPPAEEGPSRMSTTILMIGPDGEYETTYGDLTPEQQERVDEVLDLYELAPEERPAASERLLAHPMRLMLTEGKDTAMVDIDCTYEIDEGFGCYIDNWFCGVLWGDEFHIGCVNESGDTIP